MIDKYTVINKEDPYKQSIAVNGIPCTARCSVDTLNRLTEEIIDYSLKLIEEGEMK